MKDADLVDVLCRLRMVGATGSFFKLTQCRAVFRDATKAEKRLQTRYLQVARLRRAAEEAFLAGWPEAETCAMAPSSRPLLYA